MKFIFIQFPSILRLAKAGYLSLIFTVVALCGACTSQYTASVFSKSMSAIKLNQHYDLVRKEPWVIASNTHVLVMKFEYSQHQLDARETKLNATDEAQWIEANQTLSPRLNSAMFQALQKSLITRFSRVSVTQTSSVEMAMVSAKQKGAQILLVPSVMESNDSLNTQLEINEGRIASGRSFAVDSSIIRIAAFEVTTGKLVDLASVKAKGRFFAPEHESTLDLAQKAAQVYVNAISGGQHP